MRRHLKLRHPEQNLTDDQIGELVKNLKPDKQAAEKQLEEEAKQKEGRRLRFNKRDLKQTRTGGQTTVFTLLRD